MKKHFLAIIAFLLLVVTSCGTNDNGGIDAVQTLESVLTSVNGWKVTSAKFGNEDAPVGMYDGYIIRFAKDRTYSLVRPNSAAININRSNTQDKGVFTVQGSSSTIGGSTTGITFDNVVVTSVEGTFSRNQLVLTWSVAIPGKSVVNYRWVLVPVV
ncbi:MAG: hypothetical protein EAZ97_11795 [Bacteroidetes bacterium]|nr:MAG: hypothetical protein EAZ97_11795 [Bacteroidota bacterium]